MTNRRLSGGDAATHREIAHSQFVAQMQEAHTALGVAAEWGEASPDVTDADRDRVARATREVDGVLRSIASPERRRLSSLDKPDATWETDLPTPTRRRIIKVDSDPAETDPLGLDAVG